MVAALQPRLPGQRDRSCTQTSSSSTSRRSPPSARSGSRATFPTTSPRRSCSRSSHAHRTSGGIVDATLDAAARGGGSDRPLAGHRRLRRAVDPHAAARRRPARPRPPAGGLPAGAQGALGGRQSALRPPAVALADEPASRRWCASMFTQRRKTLANALAAYARLRERDPARSARRPRHRSAPAPRDAATHRAGAACGLFRFGRTTELCYSLRAFALAASRRIRRSLRGCASPSTAVPAAGQVDSDAAPRRFTPVPPATGGSPCVACPSTVLRLVRHSSY